MALIDLITDDILQGRVAMKLGKFDTSDPQVIAWINQRRGQIGQLPEAQRKVVYDLLAQYFPFGGTVVGEVTQE